MLRLRLVVLIVALVAAGACKKRGEAVPPTAPDAGAGTTSSAPAPASENDNSAAVIKILRTMSVARNCNRVMGCKSSIDLLKIGAAAFPVIARFVTENPRLDKWWLVKVIDVVGQVRDERAVAILGGLLTDWRPELRARAALGLARLRFQSARPYLTNAQTYWSDRKGEGDPATHGAIAYALERTSGRVRNPSYKTAYLAQWPQTRERNHRTIAPVIGVLCEIARSWHLKDAIGFVRHSLDHPSPFARIEAIRAAGALRDVGAVAALIDRLSDALPSQRRAARKALVAITDQKGLRTLDDWKRWCERQRCRDVPGRL